METRSKRKSNNDNVVNNNKNVRRNPKTQKSVSIIRDNQPLKFQQQPPPNEEQQKPQIKPEEVEYDSDWEDGSTSLHTQDVNINPDVGVNFNGIVDVGNEGKGMTVEFNTLPESSQKKKKRVRRVTAIDKEVAELVHKAHLLCLLARGRFIDSACDDPLLQAALLSLLPQYLLKLSDTDNLRVNALAALVSWFHQNFHVRSLTTAEKPFQSALAAALEMRGGSPEEVAALSVALFRALNLTTRFVSILDVALLKADADTDEPSHLDRSRNSNDIFASTTLMVSKIDKEGSNASVSDGEKIHGTSGQSSGEGQDVSEDNNNSKRKGDLEFEMQLQLAMAATAVETSKRKPVESQISSLSSPSNFSSPLKKMKRISEESLSSSQAISTAIGSRKVGAPLYWAEVYCSGENMTGKWVHIDAVNAIIDGELKVEAATAACKTSLRYVVAFSGHGAKDVTRRYCAKWYKISPQRINSDWWDAVLSPLKELESRASCGTIALHHYQMKSEDVGGVGHKSISAACDPSKSSISEGLGVSASEGHALSVSSSTHSRSAIEDMELATRALTEPLPTNQLAYRNHPLYAIEKWLTKYQIMHPQGPVLGFCSGYAVYPRTCVQTLHTKDRWLREGLQVRVNEVPSKVVKSSFKNHRGQVTGVEDSSVGGSDGVIDLFGRWQTEPLCLPPAVNGIVPKNKRGQVDAWSEKCLPPGTVHLRLPRLVPVVKRLGIDFAPAMVGFDFRNGRSVPVYEGLVVCAEFREAILEAYAEEEQRREEEEKKRGERQALSRWYQLLSSMVTRQRLNNAYLSNRESETITKDYKTDNNSSLVGTGIMKETAVSSVQEKTCGTKIHDFDKADTVNHEHVFLTDDEDFDEDSMARTKRCRCGLSVEVEEL